MLFTKWTHKHTASLTKQCSEVNRKDEWKKWKNCRKSFWSNMRQTTTTTTTTVTANSSTTNTQLQFISRSLTVWKGEEGEEGLSVWCGNICSLSFSFSFPNSNAFSKTLRSMPSRQTSKPGLTLVPETCIILQLVRWQWDSTCAQL